MSSSQVRIDRRDDSRAPGRGFGHQGGNTTFAPRAPNGQGQNVNFRSYNGQSEGVRPSNLNEQFQSMGWRNYDGQAGVQSRNQQAQNVASRNYNPQAGILSPRKWNVQGQSHSSRTRRGRPPNRDRDGARESMERESMKKHECGDQGKGLVGGNRDVPQQVQVIRDKLVKGTMECMICCDRIKRSAPVWCCLSCYAIFHLNCTKKWARARNWRCPLCRSVQLTASKEIRYVCFCGKRQDPASDLCLTPHSCGQPCWKLLKKQVPGSDVYKDVLCSHVCVLQCHPRPCPPCLERVCCKLLPCGVHRCTGVCHEGDCPPCLERVTQKCRCGSTSRTAECYKSISVDEKFVCEKPCGQKKNCGRHCCSERCFPLSRSRSTHNNGDWDPHLCSIPCGKKLQCGQHSCQFLCHSGHCPPCLESILGDLTCACGRTSLPPPLPYGTPLPSCQYPCSVPQPCGHQSSHSCHFGDCPLCSVQVAKECVRGHILRNLPCWSEDIECSNPCGKTRKCGIHACGRACHTPPCDSFCSSSESGLSSSCGHTCGAPRRDCRHT